jgi:hypothetical protein
MVCHTFISQHNDYIVPHHVSYPISSELLRVSFPLVKWSNTFVFLVNTWDGKWNAIYGRIQLPLDVARMIKKQ